ncbi:serine hydrolase [Nonomuraea sp. NPDC000554]|uniref:serine hydrolase n=1 Tax=Nonomuraea sp. NPDC000554 TaxID=3154259 RepID=UPI00331F6D97
MTAFHPLPTFSEPELAPDGSTVAYVVTVADRETDGYRKTVWLCDVDTGARRQLTSGPDDTAPRWSSDGARLAYLRAGQLHVMPAEGGPSERLTAFTHDVSAPVWSPDGRWLAVVVEADDEPADPWAPVVVDRLDHRDGTRRRHLFLIPSAGGSARQLTAGDFCVCAWVWSPDGAVLAYSASVGPRRDLEIASQIFVVPAEGGRATAVTPPDLALEVADWSADGTTLLATGQDGAGVGHTHLYAVPVTPGEPYCGGGEPYRVAAIDRNVMRGKTAYPGAIPRFIGAGRVVFCARDRGATHAYASDLDGEPGKVIGGARVVTGLSHARGRLAFVTASGLCVSDEDGERTLVAVSPEAEPYEPVERTFTAPDGTEIHGWIIRKEGQSGPGPLLLDIHGGPHNAWGPAADVTRPYQQALAAAGWTVLLLNSRGSDGYGERFYRALDGCWGIADEQDFHCALDVLVEEGVADPERLVVHGYSYGGYLACWLTARSDRFAAAIAGGTLVDLTSQSGTSSEALLDRVEFGGPFHALREHYAVISPLSAVEHVSTPTLLLHGEDDTVCPVGQAEQWFAALREREQVVEFVRYPGGSHLLLHEGRPSHRADYSRRVVDWSQRFTGVSRRRRPLPGLATYLEHLAVQYGVPGVSVGVLDGDEIATYVAGVANLDTGVEVTADTVFQIGSNTKLLTAELIMQLVGEGRVELDAPVTRYVPEFRLRHADASAVTIRHLLCHQGGFLGDFPGLGDLGWGEDNIARYVAQLVEVVQLHPVGELWSYSNSGMVVLGRVIERLTGQPYDRAVRERIAEPAGAAGMLFRPEEIIKRRVAVGHLPDPVTGRLRVAPVYLEQPWCAPAGSITVSTAEDLLRFVRHHLGNAERSERMRERQVAIPPMQGTYGWGLGWALRALTDGRQVIGHGGATVGQVSALDAVPDAGVAVVVLTNAPGGGALGQRVVDHVLWELTGAVVADPVDRPRQPPRLDLAAYAGHYDGVLATLGVTADGDGLVATLRTDLADDPPPPPQNLRLAPLSARTFAVEGGSQYVHFLEPDEHGRPAYASALGRIFPRSR